MAHVAVEDVARLRNGGAYCPPPYYRLTLRTAEGSPVSTSRTVYLAHPPTAGLVLRVGKNHWLVEAVQMNLPDPDQLGGRDQTPPECVARVSACSSITEV